MSFLSEDDYVDMMIAELEYDSKIKDRISRGVWMMKDGAEIKISDMTDSHLINSINYVSEENPFYKILTEELEKRAKLNEVK